MLIRPATVADARRIAEIHTDAWRSVYRGIIPDEVLAELNTDARSVAWEEHLREHRELTILADDHCRVVGWATYGPCRDPDGQGDGEVYGIYLDPAVCRRGIGRQLWTVASTELAGSGFRRIAVWVLTANSAARGFYEALGGVVDAASEGPYIRRGRTLAQKVRYWCPARNA